MALNTVEHNYLVTRFMDIGVIKFGEYFMKINVKSPIYIDLRCTISNPELIRKITEGLWSLKEEIKVDTDVLCGVPYTALPFATTMSVLHDIPMIMSRKEAKHYGTKKLVEGVFKKGKKCLIIEDVISSGASILETVNILRAEGLVVSDCLVVVDRLQGGRENLAKEGITLHCLFDLKNMLTTLLNVNLVSQDVVEKVITYLDETSFVKPSNSQINLSFFERAKSCSNPVLHKLYCIIDKKKTNLCVAVDVVDPAELYQLSEALGPHICILKTHIDILGNFSEHVTDMLRKIADKHDFLIMEDRKFADIGNTVSLQYRSGIYKIEQWADIVTVHSIPGDSIIEGLRTPNNTKACVLVASMSSEGALTTADYGTATLAMAKKHSDFVIGFISQSIISKEHNFVHICPGVNFDVASDYLGQQYKTPEEAIKKHGADIIVVGRGITKATSPQEMAITYKTKAYQAYMNTCN